jgi:hypothetical protein
MFRQPRTTAIPSTLTERIHLDSRIREFLLGKLRRRMSGVSSYSELADKPEWLRTFLTSTDLLELRDLRGSWEGGNIHNELKEEIEAMRLAGVHLVQKHNVIYFERIEP